MVGAVIRARPSCAGTPTRIRSSAWAARRGRHPKTGSAATGSTSWASTSSMTARPTVNRGWSTSVTS